MTYRFRVINAQKKPVIEIIVKNDFQDEKHQRKLKQSIVDYLLDSGFVKFEYQDAEDSDWSLND